ncbi:MAG: M20 family metallopeptidase [Candidatus Thermoplasmatota archaeon]|nr:M20 family metallopeptidase [Candidatus Thermoplasmatota archaeon]
MASGRRKDPQKVLRTVKKAEVERLVRDLVRIPSHEDVPTQEKEVAEHLHEFLEDEGVESRLRTVERNRPNVIAAVKGSSGGRSLMLNGHTDTVPAYDMNIPPFKPDVRNGRLYGRGSLDMKGGLGAMAMALVAIERSKVELDGNLYLTAVVGEERRSEGTEDIILRGPRADMAIVGEPTDMEIQPSHRGLEWLEAHFHGKAAHGGQADRGVNAISMAARFVGKVEEDLLPKLRARKSRHTLPPTLNLGVIQGGQQPSSVADHCVVRIDRRWVPEETLQQVFGEILQIFDELKKEDPRFKAELRRDPANMKTMTHVPNVVRKDHRVVVSLARAIKDVTKRPAKISTFWGWTDAALMTHFGKMPTVVFGPGGAGAHSRVEYVFVDDLIQCAHVYSMAALDICG